MHRLSPRPAPGRMVLRLALYHTRKYLRISDYIECHVLFILKQMTHMKNRRGTFLSYMKLPDISHRVKIYTLNSTEWPVIFYISEFKIGR